MRQHSDKHPQRAETEPAAQQSANAPTMFLQSIVDLVTGRVVAAEALARFPNSPLFTISEVFAAAHAAGRGPDLEAACLRAARDLHAELPDGVLLAVNVSPDSLEHPGVHDALSGDLHGLIIEVTEQPITRPEPALEHLTRLRARGALLAVDDVSTGYAGLLRLARLRPDIIKVDRNVITNASDTIEQIAVIEALVSLGRRLGSLILAEGIETIADLKTLSELDVDYGQGWAIAPPAPHFDPITPAVTAACRHARSELLRLAPAPTPNLARSVLNIHQVTIAMARTARRSQFDAALTDAADALGASSIGISLLSDRNTLREIAATGTPLDTEEYPLADYPATAAALRDATMLEAHAGHPDTDPAERAVLERHHMASLLLVPLFIDDVPIGILEINHRTPHRYTARDITHARGLTEHVAHALSRLA